MLQASWWQRRHNIKITLQFDEFFKFSRIFQIQSYIFQTLFITDSIRAASSAMAASAQHQNKVFFIVCFIRSLVFPTTATLLLLVATVYLVFYTFHQESLMGFVPPAMVGLLSLIFLPFFTKMFCSVLHVSSKHC